VAAKYRRAVIQISRRICSVTIRTVFFGSGWESDYNGADLIGYVQSAEARPGFELVRTLHIDLTHDPERLFSGFGKSTKNQINRASKEHGLSFAAIADPNDDEIVAFQQFYNTFARSKGTTLCDDYNLQTLKLLIAQHGLVITKLSDAAECALCYHVYVVDGKRAMLLYSGSHFRSAETNTDRKRLAHANRLLHWRDILFFRQSGFRIYDCGGLTADANIAEFKRSFGGDEIAEYTGYVAATWKGGLALRGRALLHKYRYG
jgi:lipid II:glycine glycyltransferase (peptidoglycan interpeptide bridge formation enzyme)